MVSEEEKDHLPAANLPSAALGSWTDKPDWTILAGEMTELEMDEKYLAFS